MSFLLRRATRLPIGSSSRLLTRHASTSRPSGRSGHVFRPFAAVGLLSAAGLAVLGATAPSREPESAPPSGPSTDPNPLTSTSIARVPFGQLVRSYFVYTTLTFPFVVDYAPGFLEFLIKIPVVRSITLFGVRRTFFAQFVGGETAEELLPLMSDLRLQNKASILTYNVEVDEAPGAEAQWKRNIEETKRSIEVMGQYAAGEGGIVAIKLTALVPHASALENISQYLLANRKSSTVQYPGTPEQLDVAVLQGTAKGLPPPPAADIAEIREMYAGAREIARTAKEYDIKLLVDAEHTWFQPVVDAITLALSQEFNTRPTHGSFFGPSPPRAVVYGTYQSYLRRNPEHVCAQLDLAKAGGYALGVKLVRGAYHGQELAHAKERGMPAPVWAEKPQTDECYNSVARVVLRDIAANKGRSGTAVVFGTHNRESVETVLDGLTKEGLVIEEQGGRLRMKPEAEGRVAVAQLYGMHDNLTDYVAERLVASKPVATKCIPYGIIDEVMPYLGRRAIENKSVLGGTGGASEERRRMGAELWRRIKRNVAL
ncbi:FAD-linked oxidoreductase [Dacryopinax primogenitus]|uniref:Proline dehydrogenase n=1 Tax=Dacryopinax primogenitus (strain DJM 731) TaxID=1858805 RepID=M5FQ97_DACPD|nr:FAD-linked oxidoreductase [Dacryopinax primogenitus]EJT99035.1 FAD-linked oxidoreductase [Dacryopinax primogenitus]